MYDETAILFNLAVCLSAALVLGFITQRLKLSPLVGYLLAGVVIGKQTPGFVADRVRAWLEEIGASEVCFEEAESAIGLATLLLREAGADEDRIRLVVSNRMFSG